MIRVSNPILPGFHPDPSIVRVGGDYYIATSTFEWWPGVRLHHSSDLAEWRLVGHAVTRRSQLDLRGVPDSGGIWAPALSHADDQFWLTFSDLRGYNGYAKDVCNYLVTAPSIEGPWSDPVVLHYSGFDPSLFHDADGRKWLVAQIWDPRPGRNPFAGISLQEYHPGVQALVGEPVTIFTGTKLGSTEGPHLYRRGGYYYLITAEGGTGWNHAVTVARSRRLTGPYEVCPNNPLLSAAGHPEAALQKAGHGSLVQTPDGRWFLAHLCSRPVGPHRRCILGRETALQAVHWPEDDWPRLTSGGNLPELAIEVPERRAQPYMPAFRDDFDNRELAVEWSVLREPPDSTWLSLTERPGCLRLRGRYSLLSTFDQSLVGFRLLHRGCLISTTLEFAPRSFQQTAGLALYYNTTQFHYLAVGGTENGKRELRLLSGDRGEYHNPLVEGVPLANTGAVDLRAVVDGATLQFSWRMGDEPFVPIGPELDASLLSDDRVMEGKAWAFTGCFVALCAQDSTAGRTPADFSRFHYLSLPENPID